LTWLAHARYILRLAAYGLTDEQARATPTASSLSVGGLIKHSAAVERSWMNGVLQRDEDPSRQDDPGVHRLAPDETLADVLREYNRAAANTEQIVTEVADLGQPIPVTDYSPLFGHVDGWSVRWVVQHLIVETARHAGHADIIRETLDGATAFGLSPRPKTGPRSSG
jgi:uncharacterized damage-inducible protein DinB